MAIVTPTRLRKVEDLNSLLEISAAMNSEKDLSSLLSLIVEKTTEVLDAERTTLYLYDPDREELWSLIAQGLKTSAPKKAARNATGKMYSTPKEKGGLHPPARQRTQALGVGEIHLALGQGLAGHVAQTKESIKIDDAYSEERFNPEVDRKTGFTTRNMLVVPLLNLRDEVVGVMQVMNKKDGPFSDADMELLGALSTHAAVAIEKQNLYEENEKFFRSIVKVLAAAVDARDPVTAGHSERVAKYSSNIARALGYEGDALRLVEYAAHLHDVGKIGVPDAVLNKPGRFEPEELKTMQSHAVQTREILSEAYFPRALREIPRVASAHHEKLDGSGYPDGLSGEQIGQIARLMAIVDIYDALVAQDRPYKRAMPQEKAFSILREDASKGKLDGELVEKFIREKLYEIG